MWQIFVGFCSELSYQQSFLTLKTANRDLTFFVKSGKIHEENVINSLQPAITITQRKDIRCRIFINMFLRRENIKRVYIFQYFLHALVVIFSLSRTQIFHDQRVIWVQD